MTTQASTVGHVRKNTSAEIVYTITHEKKQCTENEPRQALALRMSSHSLSSSFVGVRNRRLSRRCQPGCVHKPSSSLFD